MLLAAGSATGRETLERGHHTRNYFMIRKAIIIFLLALSARALYLFILPPSLEDLSHADSSLYLSLADDMIESRGFNRQESERGYLPETERTPLYPAFLVLVKQSSKNYPFSVVVWQAVIDSLTCVVIALIATEFLPGLFMISGILAACNLTMIITSAHVLTDTLFLFFFSLAILASLRYLKSFQLKAIVLASIFLGTCVLTRSVALYFLPLFLATCTIALWLKNASLSRILLHTACAVAVFSCLLGPLLYRNYNQFGHASLVSQGGSHTLYWVVPLTLHFSRGINYDDAAQTMRTKLQEHMNNNAIKAIPDNPFDSSNLLMTVAAEELREAGLLDISKAWFFGAAINLLSPSPMLIPYVQSLKENSFYQTAGSTPFDKLINFIKNENNAIFTGIILLSIVITFIYFILQIIGMLLMIVNFKNHDLLKLSYLMTIIMYFLAITGPVVGIKYRLPIEPILILFLSYSVFTFINKVSIMNKFSVK